MERAFFRHFEALGVWSGAKKGKVRAKVVRSRLEAIASSQDKHYEQQNRRRCGVHERTLQLDIQKINRLYEEMFRMELPEVEDVLDVDLEPAEMLSYQERVPAEEVSVGHPKRKIFI